MPFDPNQLVLSLVDALKESNPPKKTLANQNQPAPAQPVQQPTQQPTPMPAMPQNLAQSSTGGGGLKDALGGMAKSFLGTMGETLPNALANRVLFGNTPIANQLTYANMVDQLEQKKIKEEERKQNTQADFASYLYSMKKWGKKQFDLNQEDVENAIISGAKTGNADFDSQIAQHHEAIKPMIESKQLDPVTIWNARLSAQQYDKAMQEEGVLSPKAFEQKKELKMVGRKSKHEIGDTRIVKGEGGKEFQQYYSGYDNEGNPIWGDKTDVTKPDKPDKPDKPLAKKKVMMTSPDGTMEVEGIFDPNTEVTTPVSILDEKTKKWVPKPWRNKKSSKKSGSPKNAEEFLSKFK